MSPFGSLSVKRKIYIFSNAKKKKWELFLLSGHIKKKITEKNLFSEFLLH